MQALIYRGLMIFFNNRSAVIGSLIGPLIMILLYVFLLGASLVENLSILANPKLAVDSWMLAGVIGIGAASASMSSISLMIRDKEQLVYTDFMVSPLKKWEIVLGYYLSSLLISNLISLTTILFSQLYLVAFSNGSWLSLSQLTGLIGSSFLMSLASTSLMFYLASFFQRMDSFAGLVAIVGPLIGFLTGSYVPVGSLPTGAQLVIQYFPLTSGVVLLRKILTTEAFKGVNPQVSDAIKTELGIVMNVEHEILLPVLILVTSTVLFLCLASWNIQRYQAAH